MNRQNLLCLILVFITLSTQAASTIKQELLSPVTTDAAPIFWTGTAVTTFLLLTEDSISDPVTKEASEDKPLGKYSHLGDLYGSLYPNALYIVGMLADGYWAKEQESYSRARRMFKATAYSVLVTTVLKYTAREPRPDNIHEKNSFPSGHSTTAFAFASIVAMEHEWYWGVSALAMASLTAYSRLNDGRHFLHDVVAGTTIGASYGMGVYFADKKGQGSKYAFVPILDNERTGIRLVTTF